MIKVVVHRKKLWLRGTIGKVRCVLFGGVRSGYQYFSNFGRPRALDQAALDTMLALRASDQASVQSWGKRQSRASGSI